MHKYPERKRYVYTIKTKKGDLILRFQQATAQESLDYFEMLEKLMNDDLLIKHEALQEVKTYFSSFIDKHTTCRRYNLRKKGLINLVKTQIDDYINEIALILHPTRKSVYSGLPEPKINGEKPRSQLFENQKEAIYEKTGISIDRIYDVLTLEQVGRYLDKIVFGVYEMFDEGKKVNNILLKGGRGLSEEDLADLATIKAQNGIRD